MTNKVKVLLEREPGYDTSKPSYESEFAAGFDFESGANYVINPGETVIVPTGWRLGIPEGYEVQIRPRSGMSAKTKIRIANAPGTIDSDYTGHVQIILDNTHPDKPFVVKKGARIAQGVLCPVARAEFSMVEKIPETKRGDKGFGSTGV